jgi:hypothetical protein
MYCLVYELLQYNKETLNPEQGEWRAHALRIWLCQLSRNSHSIAKEQFSWAEEAGFFNNHPEIQKEISQCLTPLKS